MKTLNDYLDMGYHLDGGMAYQRGYVSRRIDIGNQPVLIAKGGSRRGQPYILEPCFTSSQYCFRHYLTKH